HRLDPRRLYRGLAGRTRRCHGPRLSAPVARPVGAEFRGAECRPGARLDVDLYADGSSAVCAATGAVPGTRPLMRLNGRSLAAVAALAGLALVPVAAAAADAPFYTGLFARIMIFALAAVSLDLILGYGGLISFGHAA